jgi:hypothetical protein
MCRPVERAHKYDVGPGRETMVVENNQAQNAVGGPAPLEPPTSFEAAEELARFVEAEMGFSLDVDPVALRLFIKAHWKKISGLAHVIHQGD